MIKYIFVYIVSVFISSISQILLKISANKQHDSIIKEYLNPCVIIAYGIFFCSSLLTIYAYKAVPLSMGPIIESAGYIFVAFLGYVFLKEQLNKRKKLGILCILAGIAIAYL